MARSASDKPQLDPLPVLESHILMVTLTDYPGRCRPPVPAGVPLLEIVSEPDMRNAKDAAAYGAELRRICRFLGISDGNMAEGSMRCDVNISVRPKGREAFGTKVEVKNMNSFSNMQKAIEFEIERQVRRAWLASCVSAQWAAYAGTCVALAGRGCCFGAPRYVVSLAYVACPLDSGTCVASC